MLLAADVAARFAYTDVTGNPLQTLQAGQDFLLQMYVRDNRATPQGVFQAYFDLNYDPALASINGSLTHGTAYAALGTTSGDTSVSGLINEVGGGDTDQVPPSPTTRNCCCSEFPCAPTTPAAHHHCRPGRAPRQDPALL